MSSLEELIYLPLMEEQVVNVAGWRKETIDYVTNHKSKIMRQIRSIARGKRKLGLQAQDVDDVYSEVLMYMYKCDDYDLNKAIERSSTGSIVSLEGYVNVCVKYCVARYITQLGAIEKETISECLVSSEDDKELSIWDTIADPSSDFDAIDNLDCSIEDLCKSCEPLRYRFGPDLYLILYVRLLTSTNTSEDKFRKILEVLDITKRDLAAIDRYSEDSVIVAFVRAIVTSEVKVALSAIEKYVYGAKLLKQAILLDM